MATLVTTAVIRAYDMLTGPLNAMAGNIRRANSQIAAAGATARSSTGGFNRFATGVGLTALSIGGLVQSAKETSDALQGIGYAKLFDPIEQGGGSVKGAISEIEKATATVVRLADELKAPPKDIAKTQEALAKAGLETKLLAEASKNIQIAKFTDPGASVETLAAYTNGVLGLAKAYNLLDGATEEQFIKRALGSAAAVAARTPLSTGSFIQSKSAAQGIMSAAGLRLEEQDALLGVLAARNISPDVAATTIRSDIATVLSPTPQRMKSWAASGLKRGDYMTGGASDPTRIIQSLRMQAAGRLDAKELKALDADIMKASKQGELLSDEFQNHIIARMGKMMGMDMRQEANLDAVREMWAEAATKGGVKIDFVKLLRDVAALEQEQTGRGAAILGQIFEQKRHSTNLALMTGFLADDKTKQKLFDDLVQASKEGASKMDQVLELHMKSQASTIRRIEAAWELFTFRLSSSPAMVSFLDMLNDGLGALSKANPALLDFGVRLATLGLLAIPALAAARGIGAIGAVAIGAALGLGRLVALPFAAAAAGLRSLGMAAAFLSLTGGAMGLRLAGAAAGAAGLMNVLGRVAGIVAPIAGLVAMGGLAAVFANADAIGKTEGWANFLKSGSELGASFEAVARSVANLFGFDPKGSALVAGVSALLDLLAGVVSFTAKALALLAEGIAKQKEGAKGTFGGGEAAPGIGETETGPVQGSSEPTVLPPIVVPPASGTPGLPAMPA
ncbi:MAG: phage tail tape measure protein, partial [Hyphomicrobiaceae bacterium]